MIHHQLINKNISDNFWFSHLIDFHTSLEETEPQLTVIGTKEYT